MTRTSTTSKTRSKADTKLTKEKPTSELKKKTKKDGWEMSAREALKVNFVVSEI